MKKILAILLVLAMVIAVAPAAFAAESDLGLDGNNLGAGTYSYTAGQAGTLYYEITYYDFDNGYGLTGVDNLDYIQDDISCGYFYISVNGTKLDGYYGTIEVAEDDTVSFELWYDGAQLDVTLNLSYDGYVLAGGDDGDNDDYAEGSIFNPAAIPGDNWSIPLSASYYYNYTAVEAGTLTITASGMGENNFLMIYDSESTIKGDDAAAWEPNEEGNHVASADLEAGETVKIGVLCNSDTEVQVSISMSFVASENEGGDDNDNNNGNDQGTQLPTVNPVEAPELADGLEWDVVDGADETIETAVLGEDGYYHLNSATGPVLFIDLQAAEDLDLVDAFRNNKDIYDAYKAAVPSGIFALNEQWIEILQDTNMVGAIAWNLWLDLPYEDTWMAMCVYSESITTIASEGDDAGDIDDSGDNGEIKDDVNVVPSTADNSAVMMSMIVMVMATAGAAVVLVNKKKFA